ncbi:MAG: hypothetical protein FJ240_05155 [Nitrospira sp.]|nr:hypothetical protein [Nitrospira sp.]
MSTWEDFEHEASEVERFTKEQAPDCVQLLQDAVGLFADAFSNADNSDTADVTLAKMSLLSYNFNTLKCAVDLVLRGFYSQSMNLLRLVYENWIAFHYLTIMPDEAHVLLRGPNIGERLPDPNVMRNALGEDFNPLKEKIREWYKILCCFAHPHAVGVLSLISTTLASEETSIHYGSIYKDELFRASVYVISIWTVIMLDVVGQWIPETNEWFQKRSMLVEKVLRFIDEYNKSRVSLSGTNVG